MTTEIKVPQLGESVSEATIAAWLKQPGEAVAEDEPIAELETDKVTLEVNAPSAGVLTKVHAAEGDNVAVGQLLAELDEAAESSTVANNNQTVASTAVAANSPSPVASPVAPAASDASGHSLSPAVQKLAAEQNLDLSQVSGSGKDGRVTKGDILTGSLNQITLPARKVANDAPSTPRVADERGEERVKMSRLRQKIAERLKYSQETAAILTTFNEIDMTQVMELRKRYRDEFFKSHDTKLGFMSFFVKASIMALKEIPAINAEIDGDQIIYKNYYDIGVAVGTEQGLVVPVVRNAEKLSFAEVENTIMDLGKRARDGKLGIDELSGGTFSITNGGVYGSLLSTPIINPPQSGILGLHGITERPMAVNGEVVIRPMMYIALSYDHRLIDGKEAVSFLVRVKQLIEEPERLILGL